MKNINVNGSGAVAASPDTDVGVAGSYFYHWARDGALSMRSFMEINNFDLAKINNNM